MYTTTLRKSKRMCHLSNEFVKIDNKCKLKQNILAIKERIDKIDKRDKSKQDDAKNILKVLKVFKKRASNNELENGDYNEVEYLFYIIEPTLFIATKNLKSLKLKCSEPYLKIAAGQENTGLYDEEHRVKGPKIDKILETQSSTLILPCWRYQDQITRQTRRISLKIEAK
ncbi:unnamed protein product [Mucor fragilis]